jgi:hypothetical protein
MKFVTVFLRAIDDGVTFLTDEVCFHLSKRIDTENNTYWSSINPRQSFEVPLHDQKIDVLCKNTAAGKI